MYDEVDVDDAVIYISAVKTKPLLLLRQLVLALAAGITMLLKLGSKGSSMDQEE